MIRLSSRVRLILFFPFWMITRTHIQRSTIHLPCHVGFNHKHSSTSKIWQKACHRFTVYEAPKMNIINMKFKIECLTVLACTIHYSRASKIYSTSLITRSFATWKRGSIISFSCTLPIFLPCPRAGVHLKQAARKKQDQYMHKDWEPPLLNSQSRREMNKRWSCGKYSCDDLFPFLPSPSVYSLNPFTNSNILFFFKLSHRKLPGDSLPLLETFWF